MFGLGATELVVILVLALVLLGPQKLPGVATGLGKAIRQFRKATRDLTDNLDIDDEVKQPFRELKAALRDEPPPYVPPQPPSTIAASPPGLTTTPPPPSTPLAPPPTTAAIAPPPAASTIAPATPPEVGAAPPTIGGLPKVS